MNRQVRNGTQSAQISVLPIRGLGVMRQRRNAGREVSDPMDFSIRQKYAAHFRRVQPLQIGASLERPVVEIESVYVDVRCHEILEMQRPRYARRPAPGSRCPATLNVVRGGISRIDQSGWPCQGFSSGICQMAFFENLSHFQLVENRPVRRRSGRGDVAAPLRRLDGAGGLFQVGAVAESAVRRRFVYFGEVHRQLA